MPEKSKTEAEETLEMLAEMVYNFRVKYGMKHVQIYSNICGDSSAAPIKAIASAEPLNINISLWKEVDKNDI